MACRRSGAGRMQRISLVHQISIRRRQRDTLIRSFIGKGQTERTRECKEPVRCFGHIGDNTVVQPDKTAVLQAKAYCRETIVLSVCVYSGSSPIALTRAAGCILPVMPRLCPAGTMGQEHEQRTSVRLHLIAAAGLHKLSELLRAELTGRCEARSAKRCAEHHEP